MTLFPVVFPPTVCAADSAERHCSQYCHHYSLSELQENARVRNSTISLASTLSKKVSQLISALTPGKRQVSSEDGLAEALLGQMETAAGVMSSAKLLIHWLDHNPSSLVEDYDTFRNDVMMSALDLVAILVRKMKFYMHSTELIFL